MKVPEKAVGKRIRCPHCSETLFIPEENESEIRILPSKKIPAKAPPASPRVPSDSSYTPQQPSLEGPRVVFSCKTCGHSLEVPTSVLGQDVACPFCDDVQQVPLNATLVHSPSQESVPFPSTSQFSSSNSILDDDLFAPVPPVANKNVPAPTRQPPPVSSPSVPSRSGKSLPKPPTAPPSGQTLVVPPSPSTAPAAYDPLGGLAELPNADPFAGFYGPQPTAASTPLYDPLLQQSSSFSTQPIYQSPQQINDGTAPIGLVFQRFFRTSSQNFGALFLLGIKFLLLMMLAGIGVSVLATLFIILLLVVVGLSSQESNSTVMGFVIGFFLILCWLSFLLVYSHLSLGMYSVSYRIASGNSGGGIFAFKSEHFWKFLSFNLLLSLAALLFSIPIYGIFAGGSPDGGQGRTNQTRPTCLAMRNGETWWDTVPSSGAKTPPQEDITPPREDKTPPPEDKTPFQEEKKSPARNESLPPAPKETPLPPADPGPQLTPGTGTTEAEPSGQPTIKRRRPRTPNDSSFGPRPHALDSGDRFNQEPSKTPSVENDGNDDRDAIVRTIVMFFVYCSYAFFILSILTFWSGLYIIDGNAGPLETIIFSVGFFFRNFPSTFSGTLLLCGIPWIIGYALQFVFGAGGEPPITTESAPAALLLGVVVFFWCCFYYTVIWPLRFAFAAVAYRVAYRG